MINELFSYHALNAKGQAKCQAIADAFTQLLEELNKQCISVMNKSTEPSTREFSLVKTKLEEACLFAKKAVSILRENQATVATNASVAKPFQEATVTSAGYPETIAINPHDCLVLKRIGAIFHHDFLDPEVFIYKGRRFRVTEGAPALPDAIR